MRSSTDAIPVIARGLIVGLATCMLTATPHACADSYEFKLIHAFHHTPNSAEGAGPRGPVYVAADGSICGTTAHGGTYGAGTVYRINGRTGAMTVLHTFTGVDGLYPDPCLLPGKDGNFYGTIHGTHRRVFRLGHDGKFALAYTFPDSYGRPDETVLVKGVDGNVYDSQSSADSLDFQLRYADAVAIAHPDFQDDIAKEDQAVDNDGQPSDNNKPATTSNAASRKHRSSVSLCGESVIAPDATIYKVQTEDRRESFVRSDEPGDATAMSEVFDDKATALQKKVSRTDGQLAVWPQGDVSGLTNWTEDQGKSGIFRITTTGTVVWLNAFDKTVSNGYGGTGPVLGSDGYLYVLLASSASPPTTMLLRISHDGQIKPVLTFPDGLNSDFSSLTAGPDGSLYGILSSNDNSDSGGVFRIVHHP